MQLAYVYEVAAYANMNVATVGIFFVLYNCLSVGSTGDVVNVINGIYSKKTVSDGINLKATSVFLPVHALTTIVHINKPSSIFVHYGITFHSGGKDFYSKLQVNYYNAGSLVHIGNQLYKTPTGLWMSFLNPGVYTLEVHYKSPVSISMGKLDWQTAVLQAFWAEDTRTISDGIKCYPTPVTTNSYNSWAPLKDLNLLLHLPSPRVVLSAYQLSADMASTRSLVTALEVNGFHQPTSSSLQGRNPFLSLHGVWAEYRAASYINFNILYRSPGALSFTDCKEDYTNNKNLYAMILPPSCRVASVNPRTSLKLGTSNVWAATDVIYTLRLTKQAHVFAMYQFAGSFVSKTIVLRLSINSIPQKHTISITGETVYGGLLGMWQGALDAGTHKIALEYRGNAAAPLSGGLWETRALTIIYC